MSRQLLLDGPDLDDLMARVRREYGPEARIVKAERVRSGGLGGFFAKEFFEVTVDVPESPHGAVGGEAGAPGLARRDAARPARSLEELLDAADAGDDADVTALAVRDGKEPAAPHLSTTGDTFAAVLDSVRNLAVGAGRVQQDDSAFVPARPRAVPRPAGVPREDADGPLPVVLPASPRPTALGAPAPAPAQPPHAQGLGPGPVPDVPVQDLTAQVIRGASHGRAGVVNRTGGSTVAELLDVGVPGSILADVAAAVGGVPGARLRLSEVFAQIPRAPQVLRRPGAVVVVAGEGHAATEVARTLARRLGLPEQDIALAGDFSVDAGGGRWVISASAARKLADDAARTGVPALVALCVGAERHARADAADLLESLAPDQLWAAVEADRSVKDTRRWIESVGRSRSFDALAALRVAESSAPAQVLEYGIPVGLLDGLTASAPVWAATLDERLEDAAWD